MFAITIITMTISISITIITSTTISNSIRAQIQAVIIQFLIYGIIQVLSPTRYFSYKVIVM